MSSAPALAPTQVATQVSTIARVTDVAGSAAGSVAGSAPPVDLDICDEITRERIRYEIKQCDAKVLHADEVSLGHIVVKSVVNAMHYFGRKGCTISTDGSSAYFYDSVTGIWQSMPAAFLVGYAQYCNGLFTVPDPETGKKKRITVTHRAARGVISNVLHDASWLDTAFFDSTAQDGVACKNGFLRVDGEQLDLVPHSPAHRCRFYVPGTYSKDGRCPKWLNFLYSCFAGDSDAQQKVELLQEFLGACLLGRAPNYAKCLVLVGSGANGKSVFLDCLTEILPRELHCSVSPDRWHEEYDIYSLRNKLINLVAELPDRSVGESSAFKRVVSGDVLHGRQIRESPTEFRPKAGHIFSCNNLPDVSDVTDGFFRRFLIVQFNRTFTGAADRREAREIIAEIMDERVAIIAWAFMGAIRLAAQRVYTVPVSHGQEIEDWTIQNNNAQEFLNMCCQRNTSTFTYLSDAYDEYLVWCRQTNNDPHTLKKFASNLKAIKAYSRRRGRRGYQVDFDVLPRMAWGDAYSSPPEPSPKEVPLTPEQQALFRAVGLS